MPSLKHKIIYTWIGRPMSWLLKPALQPLISDIIVMIHETRARIAFHHGEIKEEECKTMEGEEMRVDEEISINAGKDLKPVSK